MEQLFTQALGLTSPWAVAAFDFRQSEGAIYYFQVECQVKRLPCPSCGAVDQPIHDRIERRWQHLYFFQFRAYIDAPLPRVACAARVARPVRSRRHGRAPGRASHWSWKPS